MKKLVYLTIIVTVIGCSKGTQQITSNNDSITTDTIIPKDTPDIIYTDCIIEGDHSFNIDEIIREYKATLDTKAMTIEYLQKEIKQNTQLLNNAKSNKLLLFPYSEVDSAIYVHYKTDYINTPYPDSQFLDSNFRFATILCEEKIEALLNLFNNPNNYRFGECGTPVPFSNILFFNKGELVGKIVFCCNYGQTFSYPDNKLDKYGALNELGDKKLSEISLFK